MTLSIATAYRTAMVDALVDGLDAGTGAGTLQIRSGTRPANPNTTATGTLLATVTCADPAFGGGASGVATLSDPSGVTAVADGTASWFRALDSDANPVFDGDVTATGGGGDLTLATTTITTGLTVDVTGGTVTMPAA
jgi:hypothetical protein